MPQSSNSFLVEDSWIFKSFIRLNFCWTWMTAPHTLLWHIVGSCNNRPKVYFSLNKEGKKKSFLYARTKSALALNITLFLSTHFYTEKNLLKPRVFLYFLTLYILYKSGAAFFEYCAVITSYYQYFFLLVRVQWLLDPPANNNICSPEPGSN